MDSAEHSYTLVGREDPDEGLSRSKLPAKMSKREQLSKWARTSYLVHVPIITIYTIVYLLLFRKPARPELIPCQWAQNSIFTIDF